MRVLLVKPSNLSDHIQPSRGLGYLAFMQFYLRPGTMLGVLKEVQSFRHFRMLGSYLTHRLAS